MKLQLLLILALATCLTSCLEDERVGEDILVTDPNDINVRVSPFTEAEKAVLSEQLTIADAQFSRSITLPQHLAFSTGVGSEMGLQPTDLTKALLGRVLFYDTQLSATGETSCATCHKQEVAFGDDLAFSKGINGGQTKRNSIALGSVPTFATEVSGYGSTEGNSSGNNFSNQGGSVNFFWDERASTINEQSTMTIEDEIEMGRNLSDLAADLNRQEIYRILSRKAYGTTELTPERITLALEKFCATIIAMDTPFDDLMDARITHGDSREELVDRFSEQQILGSELFIQNCASCHGFNMAQPVVAVANNGLDVIYSDKGMGTIHGAAADGVFKVPFLRNVALTAPYMHDGRFKTLREVIDHYSEGLQDHKNLHPNLRNLFTERPRRMNFTEEQKEALIAFLEMTTDRSLAFDKELSDPFIR